MTLLNHIGILVLLNIFFYIPLFVLRMNGDKEDELWTPAAAAFAFWAVIEVVIWTFKIFF